MQNGVYIRNKFTKKRFELYFEPIPESGCWIWTGCCDKKGYGRFWLNGKTPEAYRVSWELYKGPIPQDMCVLHRCDTPPCVNPNHLFIGDRKINNQDRQQKGRSAKGEKNGSAKLTHQDIAKIRNDDRTLHKISADYDVSHTLISKIKLRQIWKHI